MYINITNYRRPQNPQGLNVQLRAAVIQDPASGLAVHESVGDSDSDSDYHEPRHALGTGSASLALLLLRPQPASVLTFFCVQIVLHLLEIPLTTSNSTSLDLLDQCGSLVRVPAARLPLAICRTQKNVQGLYSGLSEMGSNAHIDQVASSLTECLEAHARC